MFDRSGREVGNGSRIFAALIAVLLIGAGCYGILTAVENGPWYIAALGLAVIFYGALWANVARTGKFGRIPLWP